jgi:hypothetical protein
VMLCKLELLISSKPSDVDADAAPTPANKAP